MILVDVLQLSRIHETIKVDDGFGNSVDWAGYCEDVLHSIWPAHVEIRRDDQHLKMVHHDFIERR